MNNKGNQIHYICIATQQNSINILPLFTEKKYKISNVKKVTILSSGSPKVMKWTSQLKNFLEDEDLIQNKVHVETLKMVDFNKAGYLLDGYLNEEQNIVINIGGGVKSIALSIWTYAIENKWERNWEIIYPNQEEKSIDVFTKDGLNSINLASEVKLDHLFKLYQFKSKAPANESEQIELINHFSEAAFRYVFYRKLSRQKTEKEMETEVETATDENNHLIELFLSVNEKIKNKLTHKLAEALDAQYKIQTDRCDEFKQKLQLMVGKITRGQKINFPAFRIQKLNLQDIVPNVFSKENLTNEIRSEIKHALEIDQVYLDYGIKEKPSFYFERIMQQEINSYINDHFREKVLEKRFNLKVNVEHLKEEDAEHDILLNIYNGQLISIDAKTFRSDPKDLLSRIKRLENLAGIYTKFVVVIPYFWADFTADNLKAIPYLKTLRSLPFFFNDHRISFCVYSDNEEDFTVTEYKGNIQKIDILNDHVPGKTVKITHYKKYISDLFTIKS